MENRINYLDNIKGFAIILVVLGHSYSNTNILTNWLNAFHMPLFFVVSGFLIAYNKKLEYKLSKKIKSIMIPYIVFSLVLGGFIGVLRYQSDICELLIYMKNVLFLIVTLQGYSVCWFLACLFVSEIIFIFLLRNTNKFRTYIFISIYIVSIILPNNIFYPVSRILLATFYLYLGYVLNNINKIEKINLFYYFILVLIHMYLCNLNGSITVMTMNLNSKILFIVSSILGILLVWGLFKMYISNEMKFLTYFGKNSIIIMLTHVIFIEIIKLLDYKINLGICNLGYAEGIIVTQIVLLLEIPTIFIMNKYFYYLFGKKKQAISD